MMNTRTVTQHMVSFVVAASAALAACTASNTPPPTPMPEWTHSTSLAGDQDHPVSLAIDDEFVYFTTGQTVAAQQAGTNTLSKVPIKGGPVTILAKGGQDWLPSSGIAVDAEAVYFSTGNQILRVPKSGGPPTVIASGLSGVDELALDDDHLYLLSFVSRNTPTPLQSVAKTGGPVETLIPPQLGMNSIGVDADFIYWATPDGIMRAKKDGSDMTQLHAPARGFTAQLAMDADALYFTEGEGKNVLMRLPKSGGAAAQIAPSVNNVFELAVADGFVYYFDNEPNGTAMGGLALRKVAVNGGAPMTLDSGGGGWVGGLRAGVDAVFFKGFAEIYSMAK